MFNKKYIFW